MYHYRKLKKAIIKDHFSFMFIDQMLERLEKHFHFFYLDGYSGFSRSSFIKVTKRRRPSLVLMECLLTKECILDHAMCILLFSTA